MNSKKLELAVGAFMVAGAITLILLAFKVSGLSYQAENSTYNITARFENIAGLGERAKVSMSGVTIGRVTNIRLDTKDYVAVVTMAIDKSVPLSTDTSASILTAGLLGEKYIGLTVGAEEETLKDGDKIEDTQSAIVLEELIGKFLFSKSAAQ
ncbi:MAG: outer membrane lipid asymmetry maintenance protein MlaD [Oceanospirillaceae bacterium]|nr:outer membrane lipid asymmetry maintenance protein MlaD [Oceanospirillaceae bacterium]